MEIIINLAGGLRVHTAASMLLNPRIRCAPQTRDLTDVPPAAARTTDTSKCRKTREPCKYILPWQDVLVRSAGSRRASALPAPLSNNLRPMQNRKNAGSAPDRAFRKRPARSDSLSLPATTLSPAQNNFHPRPVCGDTRFREARGTLLLRAGPRGAGAAALPDPLASGRDRPAGKCLHLEMPAARGGRAPELRPHNCLLPYPPRQRSFSAPAREWLLDCRSRDPGKDPGQVASASRRFPPAVLFAERDGELRDSAR